MIDLTRIRTIAPLEEIKADLIQFTTSPEVERIYIEVLGYGPEDYDADKEEALYLLSKVERRIVSLTRLLARPDSSKRKKMEPEVMSSAQ